jgi:hypothetical protein
MARSKSASRKSAAKKAPRAQKSRKAAKTASKIRKAPAAGKKAAATPKKRVAAKKAVAPPKTKAAATRAKTTAAPNPVMARPPMAAVPPTLAELDDRIAIVRGNLRDLVEQATSFSGAADEERMSQRISEQEAKLALLRKQRKELYPEDS